MTTFGGMAIQPVGFPKPSPTTPLPPWIAPRAYSYPGGVPSPYFPYNDNDNDGQPDANSDHPFDFLPGRPAANPPYPNNGNTPDNWTSRFNLLLNTQAGGAHVFDTWTGNRTAMPNWDSAAPHNDAIPMRVRVKAVQIRIRIYDPKLKNSRQLTIVQDL